MSETQFHVVRRMARDLDIPITIVACPTVREPDGLAPARLLAAAWLGETRLIDNVKVPQR